MTMKKQATKKPSAAYQDADWQLQHAIVRGVPQEEIAALRKIRDAIQK
jgi:hypothetical protein